MNKVRQFSFVVLLICCGLALNASAQSDDLVLPGYGGPMAHCDSYQSDSVNLEAPTENNDIWKYELGYGSLNGLGAASNGDNVVACTFNNTEGNNLIVYYNLDQYGTPKPPYWTSGNDPMSDAYLNEEAYGSCPIVFTDGGIIACDNKKIVRYEPKITPGVGVVKWVKYFFDTDPPDGFLPISPIIIYPTINGKTWKILIVATRGGPVFAYDAENGDRLFIAYLGLDPQNPEDYYETVNTPCARVNRTTNYGQNRVYISTNNTVYDTFGRLYAIDVVKDPQDPQNPDKIQLDVVGHYNFTGPSGASPLLIEDNSMSYICFDGGGTVGNPTTIYVVWDNGVASGDVDGFPLALPGEGRIPASFAKDPRGGFWYYTWDSHYLNYITVGSTYSIPLGSNVTPASCMSIYDGDPPVMVVTLKQGQDKSFVSALNLHLVSGQVERWSYEIPADSVHSSWENRPSGQFPAVRVNGKTQIIFTARNTGVFCIGDD